MQSPPLRSTLATVAAGLAIITFAAIGCDSNSPAASGEPRTFDGEFPIRAVATTGMVADLVRAVGGEHVEVTQLLGSGIDPHLYRATRDDVNTIAGAGR